MSSDILGKAIGLYDFTAENDGELSFQAGDILAILDKDEAGEWDGWWEGCCERTGDIGFFPVSGWVKELDYIPPAEKTPPLDASPLPPPTPPIERIDTESGDMVAILLGGSTQVSSASHDSLTPSISPPETIHNAPSADASIVDAKALKIAQLEAELKALKEGDAHVEKGAVERVAHLPEGYRPASAPKANIASTSKGRSTFRQQKIKPVPQMSYDPKLVIGDPTGFKHVSGYDSDRQDGAMAQLSNAYIVKEDPSNEEDIVPTSSSTRPKASKSRIKRRARGVSTIRVTSKRKQKPKSARHIIKGNSSGDGDVVRRGSMGNAMSLSQSQSSPLRSEQHQVDGGDVINRDDGDEPMGVFNGRPSGRRGRRGTATGGLATMRRRKSKKGEKKASKKTLEEDGRASTRGESDPGDSLVDVDGHVESDVHQIEKKKGKKRRGKKGKSAKKEKVKKKGKGKKKGKEKHAADTSNDEMKDSLVIHDQQEDEEHEESVLVIQEEDEEQQEIQLMVIQHDDDDDDEEREEAMLVIQQDDKIHVVEEEQMEEEETVRSHPPRPKPQRPPSRPTHTDQPSGTSTESTVPMNDGIEGDPIPLPSSSSSEEEEEDSNADVDDDDIEWDMFECDNVTMEDLESAMCIIDDSPPLTPPQSGKLSLRDHFPRTKQDEGPKASPPSTRPTLPSKPKPNLRHPRPRPGGRPGSKPSSSSKRPNKPLPVPTGRPTGQVVKDVKKHAGERRGETYSLSTLQNKKALPAHIDHAHLECYLSDDEFNQVFKMSKGEFNRMPAWRQRQKKQQHGLF